MGRISAMYGWNPSWELLERKQQMVAYDIPCRQTLCLEPSFPAQIGALLH
jgi:hypothetical protein